jgi:hypothetical protein
MSAVHEKSSPDERRRSSARPAIDHADPGYWQADNEDLPEEPRELTIPQSRFPVGVAIVVTSLVFAGVHGPQWPAPIALFVLSLAIGAIYHRTGSLIAAICMHAVFNGFSTLWLFLVLLGGSPAENEKTVPQPVIERSGHVEKGQPLSRDVDAPPH